MSFVPKLSSSKVDDSSGSEEEQSQVEQPQAYPSHKQQQISSPAIPNSTETYVIVDNEDLSGEYTDYDNVGNYYYTITALPDGSEIYCRETVMSKNVSFAPTLSPSKVDAKGDADPPNEQHQTPTTVCVVIIFCLTTGSALR